MGKNKKKPDKRQDGTEKSTSGPPKVTPADAMGYHDSDADSNHSEAGSDLTHMSLLDGDDDAASTVDAAELDDHSFAGDGVLEESQESLIESKMSENLDLAMHKTSSIRLAALKTIQSILSRYFLPELVQKWQMTLADVLERCLKKRNFDESIVALRIMALFCVQLGPDVSQTMEKLLTCIRPDCVDPSLNLLLRAETALALGVCSYLAVDEVESLVQTLSTLRGAWSSVKHGNSAPEQVPLFCPAVESWALLLGQVPVRKLEEALTNDLGRLSTYLESNQVEIRIGAGEAVCVLYELGRARVYVDRQWTPASHRSILDRLELLASDSLKYRAKKDRRVQRASFRQITAAIKSGDTPDIVVKFGGNESLILDNWIRKSFYDTCAGLLRSGMNAHLKKNTLLRDMFDLGPPMAAAAGNKSLLSKSERQAVYNYDDKLRTQHRGKQRDKRNIV